MFFCCFKTTIGEYDIIRGKYRPQGKIIFQKQREEREKEILNSYNEKFKDKFVCEGLFVSEGLFSGSSRRKTNIDLLLAPSRILKNLILLAVEINGKGTAKPVLYDEMKKNVYYGSCTDLENIDTTKAYQNFSLDEIHDLSKKLFGWLSPHVDLSKKKPTISLKLEDGSKLLSKQPRPIIKVITPGMKSHSIVVNKENSVKVKYIENQAMVMKIKKMEKKLEDEKNINTKMLLKCKNEKIQSAEVIASLKRKLAESDSKIKSKSQHQSVSPIATRKNIPVDSNPPRSLSHDFPASSIPPIFPSNQNPYAYPPTIDHYGYSNHNPHGYPVPTHPPTFPPPHNPYGYSAPTHPSTFPPPYNPYGYPSPSHSPVYPPNPNSYGYPSNTHPPAFPYGFPQVFGVPPNHPTHGYLPAAPK